MKADVRYGYAFDCSIISSVQTSRDSNKEFLYYAKLNSHVCKSVIAPKPYDL